MYLKDIIAVVYKTFNFWEGSFQQVFAHYNSGFHSVTYPTKEWLNLGILRMADVKRKQVATTFSTTVFSCYLLGFQAWCV
jgi:ABC-type nitrate/sulfonate/bicarbonate transport system substrate-binding protein